VSTNEFTADIQSRVFFMQLAIPS